MSTLPRLRSNAFQIWAYLLTLCPENSRLVRAGYRELRVRTGITSNRAVRQALQELEHYGYIKSLNLPTAPGRPQTYSIPDQIGSAHFPLQEALQLWVEANALRRKRRINHRDTESTGNGGEGKDLNGAEEPEKISH